MRGEDEDILEEIEREVQKILSREREKRKMEEKPLKIRYFKSVDRETLRKLIEGLEPEGAVLIALKASELESIKEEVSELAKRARELNGEIYLIRWPILLVTLGGTELEIHEG